MLRHSPSHVRSLVRSAMLLICIAFSCSDSASAQQQGPFDSPDRDKASQDEDRGRMVIMHVSSRPVQGVAQTLDAAFTGRGIIVTVDVDSNVLILRGEEESVDDAVKLVRELDQPPRIVNIDVAITVAGTSESDDGSTMETQDQLQLTTLDDVRAQLQFGQQVSVPTGMVQQFPGRSSRSYQRQNTGTLIQATPKIMGNDIVLKLEAEKSWIEFSARENDDSDVSTPPTFTSTLNTTLHLQDGVPQTVKARVSGGEGTGREVVITVSATIGAKVTDSDPSPRTPRSDSGRGGRGGDPRASRSGFSGRGRGGFGSGSFGRGGFGGPSAGRPSPTSDDGIDAAARGVFERFDTDRDGTVSAADFDDDRIGQFLKSRLFDDADALERDKFLKRYRELHERSSRSERGRSPNDSPESRDSGESESDDDGSNHE